MVKASRRAVVLSGDDWDAIHGMLMQRTRGEDGRSLVGPVESPPDADTYAALLERFREARFRGGQMTYWIELGYWRFSWIVQTPVFCYTKRLTNPRIRWGRQA